MDFVPRLVVADFDGTLLHTDKTMPREVARMARDLRGRGILFAVETARPANTARALMEAADVDIAVYHNGAIIDMDFHARRMSPESVPAGATLTHAIDWDRGVSWVRAMHRDMPAMALAVVIDDHRFANFDMTAIWPGLEFSWSDFADLPAGELDKINAYPRGGEETAYLERSRPDWLGLHVADGSLWMYTDPAASKEQALLDICRLAGVSPDETVAFGDDAIDAGMLRAAGHGVAVANAIDGLKAVADEVCASNDEDGVVAWVDAHILSKMG